MARLNAQQTKRKDMAKILYVQGYQNIEEIAEKLWCTDGQSETARSNALKRGKINVSNWVHNEGWNDLRTSLSVTRDANLKNLYNQISTINNNIAKREPELRVATQDEADRLTQLADIISKLEKEIGIAEIVNTGMQFIDWIRTHDIGAAKEVCNYWDEFLKFKMTG